MKSVPWEEVNEDRLIGGIRRRIVTGEKVMLGRIYFPEGAIVPAHQARKRADNPRAQRCHCGL